MLKARNQLPGFFHIKFCYNLKNVNKWKLKIVIWINVLSLVSKVRHVLCVPTCLDLGTFFYNLSFPRLFVIPHALSWNEIQTKYKIIYRNIYNVIGKRNTSPTKLLHCSWIMVFTYYSTLNHCWHLVFYCWEIILLSSTVLNNFSHKIFQA